MTTEHPALTLLKRIRQWDMLDSAADGPFWKSQIDQLMADMTKCPMDHEIAKLALQAFDESEIMNVDHIRSGILPREASRNFSMQAAMSVIDDLRAGKPATIYISEDDPRLPPEPPTKPKSKRK